jgi:hypothetical protein
MIGGHLLEAGTEVGEGTGYPVYEPSNQMEGVDETAKGRINELHQKLYGKDAPWHDPIPSTRSGPTGRRECPGPA